MQLGLMINPGAGRRSALRLHDAIADFCRREGIDLLPVVLDGDTRIEAVVHRMVPEVDIIGVVGGDGSLNGIVNGILASSRPEMPVAFFPAGRGKDIARTLRSWNPGELHRHAWSHSARHIDAGRIESSDGARYFLDETSIGLGALAARSAAALPRTLGAVSYLVGTASALVRGRPFAASLILDETTVVELGRCHHITIANGRYFGGGLQIAPAADPEDGLLDVIAVADVSALTIAGALPRLFRATHLTHPAVQHWRVSSLRVETSRPLLVESDGEVWTSTPITVSIAKQALTWVEPT